MAQVIIREKSISAAIPAALATAHAAALAAAHAALAAAPATSLAASSDLSLPVSQLFAHSTQPASLYTRLAQPIAKRTFCSTLISGKGISTVVVSSLHPTLSPSLATTSPLASHRTGSLTSA